MERIKDIHRLKEVLDQYPRIAFLGGAGVSTESGVPDFRSKDGLYNLPHKESPEKILSRAYFFNQPKWFYDFYKEKIAAYDPLPNPGHRYLKELEMAGRLNAVITQNIDGLHQMAGSQHVIELHGNIHHNHCVKCQIEYPLAYIRNHQSPVRCDLCQGLVKPDVVLYGEPLDEDLLDEAIQAIRTADLLIVAGTSLNVYPAAGLTRFAKKTLLINKERTSKDIFADYAYYAPFGATCDLLMRMDKPATKKEEEVPQ